MKTNNFKGSRLSLIITLVFLGFSFEGLAKDMEPKKEHEARKTPVSEDLAIQSTTPAVNAGYAISIGLSLTPGFGMGHIVQGRWKERGWIFTLSDSIIWPLCVISNLGGKLRGHEGRVMLALLIAFKTWQTADVVYNAPHLKMRKSSRFQVNPLFVYHPSNNHHLGLSLKYRF